jgi:hypothetical protein
MPFQGDPSAGAPDPALLSLLFARQDAHRKAAADDQRNQILLEQARMKAARDAAAEERTDREHRLTVIERLNALSPSIAEAQQNASQEFSPRDLSIEGGSRDESSRFANEIASLDPAGVNRAVSAQQVLGDRERFSADIQSGAFGQNRFDSLASVRGGAQSSAFTEEREAAKAAQIAATNREEQARLTASAKPSAVRALNKSIREELDIVKGSGTPREKELAQANIESLVAERDRIMFAGAPDSFVKLRTDVRKDKKEYRNIVDMRTVLGVLEQRPDLLGPQANLHQWIRNIRGLGVDLATAIQPQVIKALSSPHVDAETAGYIESIFIEGEDPITGASIEESRLEELRLGWMVLNATNTSGRQHKEQINRIMSLVGWSGPLTSSNIGIDKIRAADSVLNRHMFRLQNDLRDAEPEIEFDPKTGKIIGDKIATPSGLLGGIGGPPSLPDNLGDADRENANSQNEQIMEALRQKRRARSAGGIQ